jgi:hypothetical protein
VSNCDPYSNRAGGPKGLKRGRPIGTERKSLNKECGWKEGDRGGSGQTEETTGEEKEKRKEEKKT